jgi:hypothetical protein
MTTYNFKASKPSLFVLTFFFSLVIGTFLIIFASKFGIFPKDNVFFILFFCGLIILSIFLIKLTSFAKLEITLLDDDSISIKWLEKFLFCNKPNITYSFNEIAAYITQDDPYWEWLKIEMTDGSIYKICHSTFLTKDNYSEFVSAFVSSVQNYNMVINKNSVKDNLTIKQETIKRAKSIYETNSGLVLAGFAMVVIIALPILLIVVPSTKEPNYFMFGLGYLGAIYFLIKVYKLRKKNR